MATKVVPNVERFKANKGRVTDFYEHNAGTIREKATVMATATIFAEMKWLAEEVRRLNGTAAVEDLPRFEKVERFVARVCEEQAGAVATGQFVKVRADIFGAWRFLVRTLETVLRYVLDTEDQFALGGRVADENSDRIVLDLEEGLGDGDEDEPAAEPKKKPSRLRPPTTGGTAGHVGGLGLADAGGDDDLPGGDAMTEPPDAAPKKARKG